MADNFEKIIFQIQADTANAQAGLKTLNDQLKGTAKGVDEVKKSSMSLGDVFKQIAPTMAAVFSANILQSSIGNMKSFFDEGVKKAIEMERATQRLKAAYDGNAAGAERMLAFASKLSATTLFSKGDILAAESLAAQLGRTESQTEKMITAAMGLSNVTGVDLQTAMMQLSGTFEGVMGRMGRYDKRLKTLTDEQKRNGVAVDILAEKLGKFATQGVDTAAGAMIMFDKTIGGFKRSLGEVFLPIIAKAFKGVKELFSIFKGSENGAVTAIKNEQKAMNDLVYSIMQTNEGSQERVNLIAQLRVQYPDFLKNLKDEQLTNEALNVELNKVNGQYTEKIRLEKQLEVFAELNKKEADIQEKMTTARSKQNDAIRQGIDALWQYGNVQAAKAVEDATSIEGKIKALKKYTSAWNDVTLNILKQFGNAKKYEKEYTDATKQFSKERIQQAENYILNTADLYNNSLETVTDEILNIGKLSTDEVIAGMARAELYMRKSKGIVIEQTEAEKKAAEERLKKQQEAYIKKLEALRDTAIAEAKIAEDTEVQVLQLTKSWQQRIMDVKMSYKMATIEEKRKELTAIDLLIKEATDKEIKNEEERYKRAKQYVDKKNLAEQEAIDKSLAGKNERYSKVYDSLQNEEQRHQNAMFDIQNKSEIARTEQNINNLQTQLKNTKLVGLEYVAFEKQINNQIEEERAKLAESQKITFDDVVSSITQLAQESAKILSLFIEDYDKQIEKQQDNLSKAYDLAEKGNTTVVENEKKRMQELTRERKKYVNAQRALLMIETIANAVSAIAKSANLPPPLNIVAIAATLASLTAGIIKAKQIGEGGQTGFRKGGYTGHKGVDDVAGVVHGQEYVMTASATKGNLQYFDAINTGKLSIAQLVKESAMYRALIPRERFTTTSATKPDATLSKLDSIEKSIKGQNRLTLKIDKNGISGIVSQYQSRQNRINKITRLG